MLIALPGRRCYLEAVAQDEAKKDTRETRRTPALRNKVYERLAEAQVLAEEKDYAVPKQILTT